MLNISKKIFLFAVLLYFPLLLSAQTQDRRVLKTKIADILASFPGNDSNHSEKLIRQIYDLQETGIEEMILNMAPTGKGDNTKAEFAISGLSFLVMKEKDEGLRQMVSKAYLRALHKLSDPQLKAFIISQIQIVGKDEAVHDIAKLLTDEDLCDPASNALIQINTATAKEALLNKLLITESTCKYAIVKALGLLRYKEAAGTLNLLTDSNDMILKKLSLYAIANIGDPSSGLVLEKEAALAGYTFNELNATAALFTWAGRMTEEGNIKPVEKLAKNLVKNLHQDNQVHARIAALKLLVSIQNEKALPSLIKASKDKNKVYRVAALELSKLLESDTDKWLKEMQKANPEVKAEIITMLAQRKFKPAYEPVLEALADKDARVRLAAIKSIPYFEAPEAVSKLISILNKGDMEEAEAVKSTLLTMPTDKDFSSQLANAMPSLNFSFSKVVILTVLGDRRMFSENELVLLYATDQDQEVRQAALNALRYLGTKKIRPELFSLLIAAKEEGDIKLIQDAIISSFDRKENDQNLQTVLEQFNEVPQEKQYLFYDLIAYIGGKKALQVISREFHNGDTKNKSAALKALSKWNDASASWELLSVARNSADKEVSEEAVNALIRQVSSISLALQNKYLILRSAMELATNPQQKNMILREIAKCKTFPALLYAGQFLSDIDLKSAAGTAVMEIAFSNKDFNGPQVRALLEKTIDILDGFGSEYNKEAIRRHLKEMPEDPVFSPLFNGKDLTGWKGLVGDPVKRAAMNARTLEREQVKADKAMRESWIVKDGILIFTGHGDNISTVKKYKDFEMYVDWRISEEGDAGIYLRGSPQVQIWDTTMHKVGAQVGSGGLYNNKVHESKPLKVADNPVNEWNSFHIIMKGEKVTVYLNGEKVVNEVVLENYWDRSQPIFSEEHIELQAHGTRVEYRDIYLKELPVFQPFTLSTEERHEGFEVLFDGTGIDRWRGSTEEYLIEEGNLIFRPKDGSHGNLFTKEQYQDFVFRFEFQLTPGANNGLAIRAPLHGDAAYEGMELQILDDTADIYKNLYDYQYHGSVYGIIPAKRGFLKPVGEWNYQEVQVKGRSVKVILNGHVIVNGNLDEATINGTLDGHDHPGLKRTSGHIGFLGHGSIVKFRNIRIKNLSKILSEK